MTNKPNIEVPNHTDKIDAILIPILFGEDGILKPDGSNLINMVIKAQKSKLNKAKDQFNNYISNETKISALESRLNCMRWIDQEFCFQKESVKPFHEAIDKLEDELTEARNRGHNV